MQRLGERLTDPALLDLIADFLRCGLMRDGVRQPTRVGIPQGSPLSPLLANIVLDELDQEYTRHGWSFVRYADDCILLARSEAEARALLDFTREFLTDRLHLRLHPTKTRIVQPADVHFLGFTYRLSRYGTVQRRITHDALAAFRNRVAELARLDRGEPLEAAFDRVGTFFCGWAHYYQFTQDSALQAACRHAAEVLRARAWEHWSTPQERDRQLQRLGIPADAANRAAYSLDLPGPEDDPRVLQRALPNAFFERFGLTIRRPPPEPATVQPLTAALGARRTPTPSPTDRTRRRVLAFLARRLRLSGPPDSV